MYINDPKVGVGKDENRKKGHIPGNFSAFAKQKSIVEQASPLKV